MVLTSHGYLSSFWSIWTAGRGWEKGEAALLINVRDPSTLGGGLWQVFSRWNHTSGLKANVNRLKISPTLGAPLACRRFSTRWRGVKSPLGTAIAHTKGLHRSVWTMCCSCCQFTSYIDKATTCWHSIDGLIPQSPNVQIPLISQIYIYIYIYMIYTDHYTICFFQVNPFIWTLDYAAHQNKTCLRHAPQVSGAVSIHCHGTSAVRAWEAAALLSGVELWLGEGIDVKFIGCGCGSINHWFGEPRVGT